MEQWSLEKENKEGRGENKELWNKESRGEEREGRGEEIRCEEDHREVG